MTVTKNRLLYAALALVIAGAAALLFNTAFAQGAVRLGNGFFGGDLPYSITLADLSYRAALALDPEVPDAWHQRARIAFLRGDFERAHEMINKQIALHGDSFMASYYIRGLINGFDKRYEEAEKDFSRFIAWDPHNWAANNDLAWIYFSQGKFSEAEAQATLGLAANDGNPWLHMMRGMARFNMGERDEALADLLRAKEGAAGVAEDDWRRAYPGNDPRIASLGLAELHATIDNNIALIQRSTF